MFMERKVNKQRNGGEVRKKSAKYSLFSIDGFPYDITILSLVGTPKFGGIPPNLVVTPPNLGVLPLNLGVSPPNLGVIKKMNFRNLKKKLLGKLKNIILYYFLNKYFQHLF